MQRKMWGNEYRSTRICIDEYVDRVPVGRFYNPYCPEGVQFKGVVELLVKMEDMLNCMQFPQAFLRLRSFAEVNMPNEEKTPGPEIPHKGTCATFDVCILFRQNASWQGTVAWLEGEKSENFRSVMELITLMNSALCVKSS